MLQSKFIKLLMSVLKWQVSSSSNFALLFIVMTHNFSVNFKGIAFLLSTKGSHQSPNFDTFKCSSENVPNFCHFSNNKSVFLQILKHSLVPWKVTPLYFFRSNMKYFDNRNQWKCTFLSAQVTFYHFLVIFEQTTEQFFFKFCISLQGHET